MDPDGGERQGTGAARSQASRALLAALPHLKGLTTWDDKDLEQERALTRLNDCLKELEATIEAPFEHPTHPPVFVLGPPRGGTTLLSQLIAATGLFGIATNFVAKFWLAPAIGMLVQEATGIIGATAGSSFSSRRGRTDGWGEPSEFGYFWSRFFDLGQDTHALSDQQRAQFDGRGLSAALAAMEDSAGKPLMFKNNTWFTLNADLLASIFPGCVLAVCDRDPFFVAQSLWLQRLDLYGDPAKWWTVKPSDYEAIARLEPIEQVAAQAASIRSEMWASVQRVQGAHVVNLPYQSVVSDPRSAVEAVVRAAGLEDDAVNPAVSKLPERMTSTDKVRLDDTLAEQLRHHVETHSCRYAAGVSTRIP